jgi:hypothetical protein
LSNLKITINIGGRRVTEDGNSNRAMNAFRNGVMGEIIDRAGSSVNVNLGKFAKLLPKLVEASYANAVAYAAKNMVGKPSPKGLSNRNANGGMVEIKDPDGDTLAYWKVLSARTVKEQNQINPSAGSGRFFRRTGDLRLDLLGMARKYVKNTGVVSVKTTGKLRDARGRFTSAANVNKIVSLGEIQIRLMPNIRTGMLPGLLSGQNTDHDPSLSFEKKLGFSSEALKKLQGSGMPGGHRPLMQPVFTYWTLNRIPKVIAGAISSAIPQAKKIDNSSGSFVGTIVQ